MRKKKVLSFYGFLALFALGLAAFNVLNFGSLTGKVVDGEDYQESLFYGNSYDFRYYPHSFEFGENNILVKGQLKELFGQDHELQITGYSFASSGEAIGSISHEVFLGSNGDLSLNIQIPSNPQVSKIVIYIEDEQTSVRVYKEFQNKRSVLSGSIVQDNLNTKNFSSFFLGFLIFGSLVAFVVYKVKENKRNMHLSNTLSQKQQRKYIDLDVR